MLAQAGKRAGGGGGILAATLLETKPPGPPLSPAVLPQLGAGVPEGMLHGYKAMSAAAEKLAQRVSGGNASQRDHRKLAQMRAMLTLIDNNRYWYIGPQPLCPRLPPSNETVGYFRAPLSDGQIAVFEISESEFPGANEQRVRSDEQSGDPYKRSVDAARRAVQR